MYYPLYVANKWVEPLDTYLKDASLTDPAWFQYDDITKPGVTPIRSTASRTPFPTMAR